EVSTPLDPPAAPSGLAATSVSISQVVLEWTDNSGNESGFEIQRSVGGGAYQPLATPPANAESYTDTSVDEDTDYGYRVRACNDAGCSDWSGTLEVSTPLTVPAAPSGLNATSVSASQVELEWTDESGNESRFELERALGA